MTLPPNPHQKDELELFRKAHEAWSKEGRTDEQKYGAINFLTSRHFKEAIKAYGDKRELEGRKAELWNPGLRIPENEKVIRDRLTELTNNTEPR